ncbi:MAG: hypothetical protein AABY00_02260 [Nanoarchaeota archaeon]
MRKRRVLVGYGLLFVAMFVFIAFQVTQNAHFLGYVTFAPAEEQIVSSDSSEMVLSFEEPLVFSKGTGKNINLHVVYHGQTPLVSCELTSESPSSLFISSSFPTVRPGEEGIMPVTFQVLSDFSSDTRNLSLLFSCEGYRKSFLFSFTLVDEPLLVPRLTGLSIQEDTKSKISWVTFVFIGVIIVLMVAHFFHRRDRRFHEMALQPRRKLIPLDLSS